MKKFSIIFLVILLTLLLFVDLYISLGFIPALEVLGIVLGSLFLISFSLTLFVYVIFIFTGLSFGEKLSSLSPAVFVKCILGKEPVSAEDDSV